MREKNRFQKSQLENGLRIVVEPMSQTRAVTIGVWLFGGSRCDPPGKTGMSHLLEHMLFKGTMNRTAYEIATAIEKVGGHLNAFTEKEYTCFYITVLDEYLSIAIDVLSDLVLNPRFEVDDFINEKQVILEEIHNLIDTPDDYIHDLFINSVFHKSMLGESILGTEETLKAITLDDIIAFWKKQYIGKAMILSCAGNFIPDKFYDQIKDAFSSLPSGTKPDFTPFAYGQDFQKKISYPISQSHVCVGNPGLSYYDANKYALVILNTYLGAGMSSRLFQTVRELKGLAYSVYSFTDYWSDCGLFGIYAGTNPERMTEAQNMIQVEIDQLKKAGIPQEELAWVKEQLKGNLILSNEDTQVRMSRMAKMEGYTGSYLTVETMLEKVYTVQPEDIEATAKKVFNQDQQYSVLLQPRTI
ncbi:insulinase family protein [candidate division KSB1 bacterium]|nr:insulinase family protein [candidate division KSB1 bacterium]